MNMDEDFYLAGDVETDECLTRSQVDNSRTDAVPYTASPSSLYRNELRSSSYDDGDVKFEGKSAESTLTSIYKFGQLNEKLTNLKITNTLDVHLNNVSNKVDGPPRKNINIILRECVPIKQLDGSNQPEYTDNCTSISLFNSELETLNLNADPSTTGANECSTKPKDSVEFHEEIYEQDKDGDTLLHTAVIYKLFELCMLFIDAAPHKNWLNIPNLLLQTPLHLAVITKQAKLTRRLVTRGASVSCQDNRGNTPVHIACMLEDTECLSMLLRPVERDEVESGADIVYSDFAQDLKMRNFEGKTPLHIAAENSNFEVMKILISRGADVNAKDGKSGRTVLHYAAESGNVTMINFLLSNRQMDIQSETFGRYTPVQLAFGRNHHAAVEILRQHGAQIYAEDCDEYY